MPRWTPLCWAGWVPSLQLSPISVPRAGRQAVPRAALTGRFVLCWLPGGETKGAVRRGRRIVPAAMR